MKNFKGFQLIKLIRALNKSSHRYVEYNGQTYKGNVYEVEFTDVFGETVTRAMTSSYIDERFGRLRMFGHRFAKVQGGQAHVIDEIEYNRLVGVSA